MKTYFRLIAFSKPYSSYIPQYLLLVIPSILFGLVNFSLLIPLLDVLFNLTEDTHIVTAKPEFSFSFAYIKDIFFYYFHYIIGNYGKSNALVFVCLVILTSVFLSNFFKYWSQRVLATMRTNVVYRIRRALFEKLSTLHLGYFSQQRKGDLMSTLSGDVHEIENSVVSSVQVVFREPLMIIGFFILLFSMSVKLTIFTLLFLPISGLIIASISKQLRKKANLGQSLLGRILSVTEEMLSGARIIKAFNAEKYVQEKFDIENKDYTQVTRSILNKRELASPLSEFLGVSVVIGVLIYGGQLVLQNESELKASEFVTYIILYSQILAPAKNISSAITNIQRGLAAGDRVLKVIDTSIEIKESPDAKPISSFTNGIEYRNLSFAYTDKSVLKNINLHVRKGRTIALVGQSGSGKSTLADLVPRFYDATQGEILIDGQDIRTYKIADLRGLMGIVSQEAILFNDTIFNNIAFGMPEATEEEVIAAAKIANAHDFISQIPGAYQSNIGDRGTKLSGGQRQRLSIARAVLKNPPILILDEATSALDTESERLVQDALNNLMKNRTTIVIAHRLSTIQHADEIIVLHQGEIIERGTHTELLKVNGTYRKLYELQAFA